MDGAESHGTPTLQGQADTVKYLLKYTEAKVLALKKQVSFGTGIQKIRCILKPDNRRTKKFLMTTNAKSEVKSSGTLKSSKRCSHKYKFP